MSFSSDVKKELTDIIPKSIHCRKAELSGIIAINGRIEVSQSSKAFIIRAENDILEKKIRKLSDLVISESDEYLELRNEKLHHRKLIISGDDISGEYFNRLKLGLSGNHISVNEMITERSCCKQCYLRGAFLAGGSVGSPDKNYQLSITCAEKAEAEKLCKMAESIHLTFRLQEKKDSFAVYVKDGDTISAFLAAIGAANSVMEFENIRILKDIRNAVNREVNCDAANIRKAAGAATKQIDDIRYIMEHGGLEALPDNLRTVALARMDHPLLTIKELGEELSPQLSKSCINHRLRKISEIADGLRKD